MAARLPHGRKIHPFIPFLVAPDRPRRRQVRPDTMTLAKRISAIFCIALTAGCASLTGTPSNVAAQTGPLVVDPSLLGPLPVADPPVAAADPPAAAVAAEATLVPVQPAITPSADRAARPPAKPPVKLTSPIAAPEQTHKNESTAPLARKPEPPLDVAALKTRLRDTSAIGVFTKLALRNQMDDLLQRFRSHYQAGQKTGVAHLRQPYDLLVLKVLAVVQEGDPSLARTISGSREAIWTILADPEQFKAVT